MSDKNAREMDELFDRCTRKAEPDSGDWVVLHVSANLESPVDLLNDGHKVLVAVDASHARGMEQIMHERWLSMGHRYYAMTYRHAKGVVDLGNADTAYRKDITEASFMTVYPQ